MYGKRFAANGARAGFHVAGQRRRQRGFERQDAILKIPAIAARPPLVEHIAGKVGEQTLLVILVIVGAQGNDELFNIGAFCGGQFAGFRVRATSGQVVPKLPLAR